MVCFIWGTLTLVYDVNMGLSALSRQETCKTLKHDRKIWSQECLDISRQYRPLGAEMQQMEISGHFTLDSDEDKIREEDNLARLNVEVGVNGHGSQE
ncbi:hypothetical protein EZV62_016808 [Acer yangbiense]|uniref:Uncharacterized protein n=1 Tax=Acer yangbiense TaxID=1000413 RepID=A0A5C7HQ73_9ROSI|nr:hypothetical protein EZV62_016808 [Acer yangbiense]